MNIDPRVEVRQHDLMQRGVLPRREPHLAPPLVVFRLLPRRAPLNQQPLLVPVQLIIAVLDLQLGLHQRLHLR